MDIKEISISTVIAASIQMVESMKESGSISKGTVDYDTDKSIVNINVVTVIPTRQIDINFVIQGEETGEDSG